MYDLILVLCSTLLGFCLSLITFLLAHKVRTRHQHPAAKRLKRILTKIDSALETEEAIAPKKTFEHSLEKASLTTGLQIPRIRTQCHAHTRTPEKYTILAKLVSQGMQPEEIAGILDISITEVTQLITLKNMAQSGRSA
ncbi:MAG: hypothetical protein CSA33_03200 [Desulfobulbus propionicus]|nr:MAG: hypothetical protein CSA33_03200 [Desulfobulbus propionicus]